MLSGRLLGFHSAWLGGFTGSARATTSARICASMVSPTIYGDASAPSQGNPVVPDARHILFLQGPTSSFWRDLSFAFEAAGHRTSKIVLHLGDQLWWRRSGAAAYRGHLDGWQAYLDSFVAERGITDILYYADRQPYHVIAQSVARLRGIDAYVIENGYLRPDWITLEPVGMGAFSTIPGDPALIRAAAVGRPDADMVIRYRHGFLREMLNEFGFHACAEFGRPLYPHYRSGRYANVFFEFGFGALYQLGQAARSRAADGIVARLTSSPDPFYLVPLQLQSDKQISANSPFSHLSEMIEIVVRSFAAHAPPRSSLLFKQHPHDNGWENWPKVIERAAARAGVGRRVHFIAGGNLDQLLDATAGCVTVNSTVGLHAIRSFRPVKTLGTAVFDVAGLTHQASLDSFWTAPEPVDPRLARDFLAMLAASFQAKGSFYDRDGKRAAIAAIVDRISADCHPRNPPCR
jgi:capsular polysaccharide export protein